ncbi:hypothetical protein MTO96_001170 [Rhipicephalus appendiculatus]
MRTQAGTAASRNRLCYSSPHRDSGPAGEPPSAAAAAQGREGTPEKGRGSEKLIFEVGHHGPVTEYKRLARSPGYIWVPAIRAYRRQRDTLPPQQQRVGLERRSCRACRDGMKDLCVV